MYILYKYIYILSITLYKFIYIKLFNVIYIYVYNAKGIQGGICPTVTGHLFALQKMP